MTNNKKIAEWVGWKPQWNQLNPPPYDADITLWHGENGLLAEIDKEGLVEDFINAMYTVTAGAPFHYLSNPAMHKWAFLCAAGDPILLAEALVETINEESNQEERCQNY